MQEDSGHVKKKTILGLIILFILNISELLFFLTFFFYLISHYLLHNLNVKRFFFFLHILKQVEEFF